MDSNYGPLDRLLHKLALSSNASKDLAFDLERTMFLKAAGAPPEDNVFVCGLARSGTTALLNALHQDGSLATTTYQDMPFVLAPNLWARIARPARNTALRERAHGDGILINAQSPEAFEEVFWSVFADTNVGRSALQPHGLGEEALEAFKGYMALVCFRYGKRRYLSKGNGNILRLDAIASALPSSRFLVPFRRPEQHAASLLAQHLHFRTASRFHADYMRWIGHFEFGVNLKPVRFPGDIPTALDPLRLDYWVDLWCRTYSYLMEVAARHPNVRLVCYEEMAATRPDYVRQVAEFCAVKLNPEEFIPASRVDQIECSSNLLALADLTYQQLLGAGA